MQKKLNYSSPGVARRMLCRGAMALTLSLGLLTSGCLSPLAKHSAALSAATTPVVDEALSAYHAAEALHDMRVDYDAVAEFDNTQVVYNPRKIQPLMEDKDIEVRVAVLEAFQFYARSLVEISSGTSSPELDAASRSVGQNLSTAANSLAPAVESTFGIVTAAASTTETTTTTTTGSTISTTSSTSSTAAPVVTPAIQNGISTAVNALAQFLVSRKIKKELPQRIKEMDPHLQTLCELLEKDLATLQDQEQRDYNSIINRQTLFIRQSQIDPQQRREQIMKLPEIVRQQRATDQQLAELKGSIGRLALTHHALAADAQGNNPVALTSRLADLEAAGNDLGKFYSASPTQ